VVSLKELFRNPTPVELDLAERYAHLPHNGQRERNFEAFAMTGLPHRRVESWKWSDLRNALPKLQASVSREIPEDAFRDLKNAIEIRFGSEGLKLPQVLPEGMRLIEQADGQALGGAEEAPVAALGAALSAKPGALLVEVTVRDFGSRASDF
jgi:Fe-S cluster assembly protein SufD